MPTFLYHMTDDSSNFLTRSMVGRGLPLYLKLWAKLTPFLRKRRFSIDFRS